MSDNRVTVPKEELTVYEQRIRTLRRVATLFRGLGILAGLMALAGTRNLNLRDPSSTIPPIAITIIGGVVIYALATGFDFLADSGLILLSMKRESQYVSRIVKEVREGRETGHG